MAFNLKQEGTTVTFEEGYFTPAESEITVTGTDTTVTPNETKTSVIGWTVNQLATFNTTSPVTPENTWIDPKKNEQLLVLMPMNWQLVCDELVNGGSYSLSDLSSSASATTMTVKYEKVTPKDGSVADSEETSEWITLSGFKVATEGPNVYSVQKLTDFEVKIEPDSALLSTYSPLVDIDGKWSDSGVLKSIKFTSNKNHRINIHWSKDCVETFYFVASL